MKPRRVYLESIEQASMPLLEGYLPHDPLDHPKVLELRALTQIEKQLRPRKSEFEQALAIARYVSSAWKHDGFNSNPKKKDALTILKLARKGHSFACTQFATVFAQVCQCVGIPARAIGVLTKRPELGSSGHAHATAEYFDNELAKWVWIDPQVHAYATHRSVPLSFTEFSNHVIAGKTPRFVFSKRTLEYVRGDRSGLKDLENFFKRYVWTTQLHATRDVLFTKQTHIKRAFASRNGAHPGITFQGFALEAMQKVPDEWFDAPVNRVQIAFSTQAPKRPMDWKDLADYRKNAHLSFATPRLELVLSHNMPWFDRYEIRHNGRTRSTREGRIQLTLKPGRNAIEARAVNAHGRKGPASSAVIRFDSAYPVVRDYW